MHDIAKCKDCGANTEVKKDQIRVFCCYCGSKVFDKGEIKTEHI